MKFTYQGNEYKLILFTIAGSRFYGTQYEKGEHPFKPDYVSDTDYRGIFIANPDTKLGLTGKIEEIEVKTAGEGNLAPPEQLALIKELNEKLGLNMAEDEDLVLYEVKKFITMALENNPNIMDLVFTDDEAVVYENKKGKKLRTEGKSIFMSTKTKFTFSGYAMSQLKRIKGHNKWIVKYPKTANVLNALKVAYESKDIDYYWITDHFGGRVSEFVSGVKQKDINKLGSKYPTINWEDFVAKYAINRSLWEEANSEVNGDEKTKLMDTVLFIDEVEKYRKPQLIDYCTAKDLKAKKFPLDTTEPHQLNPNISTKSVTVKEFLMTEASFRTVSKTQYNIFTPATPDFNGGIFARNGNLKVNDPEEVGEFVFQLSIDETNYQRDLDDVEKLWEWRTGRNEKRSVLEEHFGYDTKHMSHTIRLLIGGYNILQTGEYHPRLTGENLKFVKEVLNGVYTYDYLLEYATNLEKKLDAAYETSTLPKTPDHKKANELLLELSRKF
jgi:predicted nucleotidyltransferase